MDFYASDAFLTALARDFYRAKTIELKTYGIQGSKAQVRLAEINGKKAVHSGPFYDYVKPLPGLTTSPSEILRYVPKVVASVIALPDEDPTSVVPDTLLEPAPLVIWAAFETWEAYLALIRKRSKSLLRTQRQRLRKLTEQFGEPEFTFDNPDTAAFHTCLQWKIQQYKGGHETLESAESVAMLRRLFEDGHLILSTLKVADEYVAFHAGFIWQDEYLALIPAYSPAFAKHGIGKEMLLRVMKHSFDSGHRSFDFLQGAETYKWEFATHVQIIESLGTAPLLTRVKAVAAKTVKQGLLSTSPELFYRVKRLVLDGRQAAANVRGFSRTPSKN
ncbi:GNAT family N-acetyltransferase [Paenarthrobacter sp. NPDC091711]|uniref:GNAT family N-acetyltransferase n=1 Tax=Paenarthrobacter sp. NPDC091711 TaxID=3364385 RepID=UPI0037F14AE5